MTSCTMRVVRRMPPSCPRDLTSRRCLVRSVWISFRR